MQKKCPCCQRVLLAGSFSKNKNRYDGLNGHCKECVYVAKKKWKEKNRERIRQQNKDYKQKNKERINRLRSKNRKTDKFREKERARAKIYREQNKNKISARKKIAYHIKAGNIKKPKLCQVCFTSSSLHAHHHDYSDPLNVTFVCPVCHERIHNCEIKEPKTLSKTRYPRSNKRY